MKNFILIPGIITFEFTSCTDESKTLIEKLNHLITENDTLKKVNMGFHQMHQQMKDAHTQMQQSGSQRINRY
jgi:uncharacterized coiled-coil protein SlyX